MYANTSVLKVCKENKWKYIIRFKKGSIPTLYTDFEGLVEKFKGSTIKDYELAPNLEYSKYKINVVRYTENKKGKRTEFTYITDLPVTDNNIEATINLGRKRWKIENEGFNIQKNETFDIEHLYSQNQTAIKVHYILIQIAHIIRQLLENGLRGVREAKLKLKEISQMIKKELISQNIKSNLHITIQLRLPD